MTDNAITEAAAWSNSSRLGRLNLSFNDLTSVSAFTSMTRLIELNLAGNSITTLAPLAEAESFGTSGSLWIGQNPLPCSSQQAHIDTLRERGLTVLGQCAP